MNHTKIITALCLLVILFSSCSKDDYRLESQNIDPFIRFNFTTLNGVPLEYPRMSTTVIPSSEYENKSVKILKVPVTLTAVDLKNPVKATFSASTSGSLDTFTVEPASELLFQGNKLSDTIYLSFDKRWKDKQSITLKLENTSDPTIHIGNLNTATPNDIFTINLGEVVTPYTFPVNSFLIKGEVGEKIDFKVNFPNGFVPEEIEQTSPFTFVNGFEYSLTHDDYEDNRSSITYHMTLLEDIQNDDARYETKLTLESSTNYIATGNTILTIAKPIKTPRDVQAFPASKFTDPTNAFYLTYGEHWLNNNGNCAWMTFNALTFPIIVTKDDPNAILYSDKGTTNPNDDIYHDAFKIGFNVSTGTNTVNSFGLKRWFSNESNSASVSPGFNITSALEFFPANGNSKTGGTVLVIPQYITIGKDKDNTYQIAISGDGTYKEISNVLYEITFELKLTNDKLFGGTVSTQYRMYNNKTYPKPTALSIPCPKEVTL